MFDPAPAGRNDGDLGTGKETVEKNQEKNKKGFKIKVAHGRNKSITEEGKEAIGSGIRYFH
jgi:hypothetical protein